MLVISPGLSAAYADSNAPVIGWNSLVTTDNIASSGADADYPVSNLANPNTSLLWKASSTTSKTITLTLGTQQLISFVGMARHNFNTEGCTVKIEISDDGVSYVEVIAAAVPIDDRVLVYRFEPTLTKAVKITIGAAATNPAYLAVLYIGDLLVMQRSLYVGHVPVTMGISTEVANGRSENGNYLGRIQVSQSLMTSMDFQNLTASWVRATLRPFLLAAQADTPFFFAWRPYTYPNEVAFGWMPDDPKVMNQRENGMMQASFGIRAIRQ